MIRVAILGGGIGAQHLDAYATLDAFHVTHLADQDATRREALCTDTIAGLSNIEDALIADVDVIDICLPPHLHAPVVIAALEAGKHVICEKPLGTSMAQWMLSLPLHTKQTNTFSPYSNIALAPPSHSSMPCARLA